MNLNETDLIKVVDELRLKGYSDTFTLENNKLISETLHKGFTQNEIKIEAGYQFDILEQPFDTQYLFTVQVPALELKGLLIDLLGTYYFMEEQPITQLLRDVNLTNYMFDAGTTNVKYGLRKITPFEFNTDPERYVLKIGYPDFPSCPAGTSFSMLGYDTHSNEYVWLATKIIKDNRLVRIDYKSQN